MSGWKSFQFINTWRYSICIVSYKMEKLRCPNCQIVKSHPSPLGLAIIGWCIRNCLAVNPLWVSSRFCHTAQLPVRSGAMQISPMKRLSKAWQGSPFPRSHFLFFPLFERFLQINNLVYFSIHCLFYIIILLSLNLFVFYCPAIVISASPCYFCLYFFYFSLFWSYLLHGEKLAFPIRFGRPLTVSVYGLLF